MPPDALPCLATLSTNALMHDRIVSGTSVLPDVARQTAEAVAAEIMKAARTPPGLTTAHPGPTRTRHHHSRDNARKAQVALAVPRCVRSAQAGGLA
jgi:hypothetical protein